MQEVGSPETTKLPSKFTFWFTYFQKSKDKQMEEFEDNLRKIADFDSAEEFWGIYQHMKRPSTLPRGCEFFLFKAGIRPLWEDEANFGGGRLFLSMKKDVITNKVWEDLQIAMIIGGGVLEFLCGSVINIRTSEVFISVWIKECSGEKREEIKEWLKKNLDLPNTNCIRWKKHPTTAEVRQKMLELKKEAEAQRLKKEALERKKQEEEKKEKEEAEAEASPPAVEIEANEVQVAVEKEKVPEKVAEKQAEAQAETGKQECSKEKKEVKEEEKETEIKEAKEVKKKEAKPLSQIEDDDDNEEGEWGQKK